MATPGSIRTRTQLVGASADAGDFADNGIKALMALQMRNLIVSTFCYMPYVSKTGAYLATVDDCIIYAGGTSSYAITLPAASSMAGRFLFIKKTSADTYSVTVTPNGAETIDGVSTQVMALKYSCMTLHSDGSNWNII